MDDFFTSQVADLDDAIERLDQSPEAYAFARNLADVIERASSRFTLPVQIDGQELIARTEQGDYRLSVTCGTPARPLRRAHPVGWALVVSLAGQQVHQAHDPFTYGRIPQCHRNEGRGKDDSYERSDEASPPAPWSTESDRQADRQEKEQDGRAGLVRAALDRGRRCCADGDFARGFDTKDSRRRTALRAWRPQCVRSLRRSLRQSLSAACTRHRRRHCSRANPTAAGVGIVRGRTLPPPASDKLAGETAELLVDQLANEELELAATLLNSGGDDLDELHESKRTTGLQGTQARGIYIGMPAVPVRGLSGKDGPHG
jgi:hypothetical protein